MNCWMRTGVFSARKVRRFCGDNRKVSRLARGIPFFDSSLAFKGKAATLLETPGNYTDLPLWCKEISEEVSARDDGIPSGAKAHLTLIRWMYGPKPVPFNTVVQRVARAGSPARACCRRSCRKQRPSRTHPHRTCSSRGSELLR